MPHSLLPSVLLLVALSAAVAAPSSPGQTPLTFWFEARGLTPEQAEIVASGFAEAAQDAARLARAARLETADVVVRFSVGGAVMDVGAMRPIGAAVSPLPGGAGGEAGDPGIPVETTATVAVSVSAIDVLDDEVLYEESLTCELPLTRGRFVAARCLRVGFPRIVERLVAWAEGVAAAFATAADFGPSDADLRRLGTAERATAYFREGVRASQAGFLNRALDLMAAAQPLFREAGLRPEEGATWEHLSYLMAATNRDLSRAVNYAEQTVRIARELSDETLEARGLALLAACEARAGSYTRAATIARSAASHARTHGDSLIQGLSVAIQAGLLAVRGNFEQAQPLQVVALELVRTAGNPAAEAQIELAIAAVTAQDDDRERSASLAQLDALEARAVAIGSLALRRDVAFVRADSRAGTTAQPLVLAAEIDAIRALKLSDRLDDQVGVAAAVGLLGVLEIRLGKLPAGFEYLAVAEERAAEIGFVEGATDSIQVLGEEVPDLRYGVELLEAVRVLRVEQGDLRGRIKTLSDLSRLQSGLELHDEAWASFSAAADALELYVAALGEGGDSEDLRESFTTVLKSLVATRTQLPYLTRYLRLYPMIPMLNPSWIDR